jgi:hypothetical protein
MTVLTINIKVFVPSENLSPCGIYFEVHKVLGIKVEVLSLSVDIAMLIICIAYTECRTKVQCEMSSSVITA